jgi:hypothetical protein
MLRQFRPLTRSRRYHRRMNARASITSLAGRLAAQLAAPMAIAATLGAALPADAQNAVTAYGGYRSGNGFRQSTSPNAPIEMRSNGAISAAVEWPYDSSRQLQLFVSHQRTRLEFGASATPREMPLRLTYVHLGGLNFFDGQVGRGPYVAGGLGVTLMNPSLEGTSSRVRASMNVGLGYQWPLGRAVALRTELRGYATLIHSNGSFFCSGGCVVTIKGDTLTQVEGLVGLSFGF